MRIALHVSLDVLFGFPFRIRDELAALLRPQQLFGDAALLPDHERSAFRLPHLLGFLVLGWIELDVNEPYDRHGVTSLPGNLRPATWPGALEVCTAPLEPPGSFRETLLRPRHNRIERTKVPRASAGTGGRAPAVIATLSGKAPRRVPTLYITDA